MAPASIGLQPVPHEGEEWRLNIFNESFERGCEDEIAFPLLRIVAFCGFGGPSLGIVTSNLAFLLIIPES
jgi:hypothetical protein